MMNRKPRRKILSTNSPKYVERICKYHGPSTYVLRVDKDKIVGYRCTSCSQDAVADRRKKIKETLVQEHGGKCIICGYNKCMRALQFHHIDPTIKEFSLSNRGHTRSLEKSRIEAAKCILVCSNCHAEIESGIIHLNLMSDRIIGSSTFC